MRLASFEYDGRADFGLLVDEGLLPLGEAGCPDLRSALDQGVLETIAARADRGRALPLEAVRFLPPIVQADKILCVGLNYRRHAEEAGMAVPTHPSIFCRFNSAQVGHGEPVQRPLASDRFDYEGELAVVIGRRGRHVPAERALDIVAGYSCFAENSVRDFQRHSNQATPGKNFFASGAFGPWLVSRDEIADPHDLMLETRVNGTVMQRETTGDMIFPIGELIAYLTIFTELLPGDVIVTGTPSGVGFTRKPPLFLKEGDVMEVEIDGLGVLRNPVVNEQQGA